MRRTRLAEGALALLVAALVAALVAPAASAREVLFVGNLGDGTVTVVDATALKTIGKLDVTPDGKTPQDPIQAAVYPLIVSQKGVNYVQGLAVSPDGHTLYVSRGYLGDVAAFDIASHRLLWRLEVSGVRADHIALSPDGRRLFVSALTSNEVQVIDTATHSFIGSFPTGDWAHVLEFTPDHRYIVNGSLGNQLLPSGVPTRFQLTFADPSTLQVQKTFSFDAGVRPFVFSPDGALAYVQFSYFNGFKVIDTSDGHIVATVPLPIEGPGRSLSPSQYPNQAAHHGIDISGDASAICDAATISDYVALVGRSTLATEAIIPVGDQPADALTSSDGNYCFVSNRGSKSGGNTLSVISYAARREVARLTMGTSPQELATADIPDPILQAAGFELPSLEAPVATTPTASAPGHRAHVRRRRRSRPRRSSRARNGAHAKSDTDDKGRDGDVDRAQRTSVARPS